MIEAIVLAYSLILARVAAFVAVVPILGGRAVPRLVKLGLAIALTTYFFLSLPMTALTTLQVQAPGVNFVHLTILLVQEVVLGVLLGFLFGLVLLPVRIAGEFIAQEMGLSLAPILDPSAVDSSVVVSQIFEVLATVLFLGVNGHHLFLGMLHTLFLRFPVGATLGTVPVEPLTAGLAAVEEWGLVLIAPLGAALFLTSIVLALMTRASPQLNIFSVGFGLRVAVGLIGMWLLLPQLLLAILRGFGWFQEWLTQWI